MRIEGQLQRLVGEAAAVFFRDAGRLVDGDFGLEAQGNLVWHCAREIESAIRDALGTVAPTVPVPKGESQHAAEIATIIKELDLRETDAAIAWWKTRPLAGLAHRSNLGPQRPFAPADWQTFLVVLELVLGAFEVRYSRMITALDGLLATTPSRAGARTRALLCNVPPTGQANALRHFFERADATWLGALPRCIFRDPPGREFDINQPGYFRWPQWHASRYLAKVAEAKPDLVHTKVMKVLAAGAENPWVHADFASAARHFPKPKMASWARAEATWLRAQPDLYPPVSRDFARATDMLVTAGLADEAFAVGEATLALREEPSTRHGQPNPRAHDYEYGKALESIAASLTKSDALRASAFLVALVDQAEEQSYPDTRDRWSTLWRSSIADDGSNDSKDTLDKMADALRKTLDGATTDQESVEAVHDLLSGRATGSSFMHRCAIYVVTVGREFAPALALRTVSDPGTYETDTWVEAQRLIAAVGAGLDPDKVNDAVAAIRASTLDESRQDELVEMLAGLQVGAEPEPIVGQPMFRAYPWVPPPSPVSAEQMARWSVPRTIRYLTQWQSNPTQHRDGDMLEFAFVEAVKANPSKWSGAGVKVLGLPDNFLERYLWGMREAAKDGAILNGNALVRLLEAGLVTGHSWLDGDHRQIRQSVAWLLRDCLDGDRLSISSRAGRDAMWLVIGVLMADPATATTTMSGGDVDELASAALNHTSSIATTAAIAYALWLKRRRPNSRHLPAEAKALIDARLDPTQTSAVVRFAIGELLVLLRWLDASWTDEAVPRIFPVAEDEAPLRDAAWRGYLRRGRVPLDQFLVLLPEYRHALEGLDPTEDTTRAHVSLAEHVLLLARLGTIGPESDDGLLPLLFSRASADLAREATHDLGWSLYNARDQENDQEEVARLRLFWEWLSAEVAAGRANPAGLEPFGWWFASGKFGNDWSLGELERLARADVEIDFMHIVFERLLALVSADPARVGQVTQAIVKHEVRTDDLHGDELPAIVRVLIDGASGPEANAFGRAIVGMMVSRGFAPFPG